jgi:hypothetical protein
LEQEAEGSAETEDDDEPSALVDKIRLKVYEFIRKSPVSWVHGQADIQTYVALTLSRLASRCPM